jgi:hypothetical protein
MSEKPSPKRAPSGSVIWYSLVSTLVKPLEILMKQSRKDCYKGNYYCPNSNKKVRTA